MNIKFLRFAENTAKQMLTLLVVAAFALAPFAGVDGVLANHTVTTATTLNPINSPLTPGQTGVAWSGTVAGLGGAQPQQPPNNAPVNLQIGEGVCDADDFTTIATAQLGNPDPNVPGDQRAWNDSFTAPATPGTYFFKAVFPQATQGGHTWLGSMSDCQEIVVEEASATQFTLDVTVVGNGSVTSVPAGINCESDCTEDYDEDIAVTLTATPDSGWVFDGWTEDCLTSGTSTTCDLTMDGDKSATATFSEEQSGPKDSELIVITGDTAAGENQPGWLFNRDLTTATPFEFNEDQASIGDGALYVLPIGTTTASDKFIGEYFLLTPIADVLSISYDFMIGSGGGVSDANEFYMNVYANFGESDDDKFYDCRYNVVPTTGSTGGFTTITFDPTQTYPVTTSGSSPYACPGSPADMDNDSPGSTIRVFALNVGDTTLGDAGLDGYYDNVIVDTVSKITTFDFEPVEEEPVDYCDPSQKPGGMSIAEWLAEGQANGAACFDYEVVNSCGSLDVQFTQNDTPYSYELRYVLGTTTPALIDWAGDGVLPVNFSEDEKGGSVDVTYYVVGAEADYFAGFGIPNIWDGNGTTVTVDTDCESEGNQCPLVDLLIVSDEDTQVNGGNATTTFEHANWTADDVLTAGTWIWSSFNVADPSATSTEVFTRSFNWTGDTNVSAMLDIATDNSYEVRMNGVLVGSSTDGDNFTSTSYDTIDVTSEVIADALNVLEITVTNWSADTDNPEANPAGLLYELRLEGENCEIPDEPQTGDDDDDDDDRRGGGGNNQAGDRGDDDDDDDDDDGEVLGESTGGINYFVPGEVLGVGFPNTGTGAQSNSFATVAMLVLALGGLFVAREKMLSLERRS